MKTNCWNANIVILSAKQEAPCTFTRINTIFKCQRNIHVMNVVMLPRARMIDKTCEVETHGYSVSLWFVYKVIQVRKGVEISQKRRTFGIHENKIYLWQMWEWEALQNETQPPKTHWINTQNEKTYLWILWSKICNSKWIMDPQETYSRGKKIWMWLMRLQNNDKRCPSKPRAFEA